MSRFFFVYAKYTKNTTYGKTGNISDKITTIAFSTPPAFFDLSINIIRIIKIAIITTNIE